MRRYVRVVGTNRIFLLREERGRLESAAARQGRRIGRVRTVGEYLAAVVAGFSTETIEQLLELERERLREPKPPG